MKKNDKEATLLVEFHRERSITME